VPITILPLAKRVDAVDILSFPNKGMLRGLSFSYTDECGCGYFLPFARRQAESMTEVAAHMALIEKTGYQRRIG
jgi:gamma-glutamyl:cysteine ligase YbdK (ATP-grasp superfamily)